ncbi:replicative DNA helicase [Mycolicibacterium mucogenicum]|uniref:replicative DNA helicase n=1 Tax=Mycolicibacterium mucogenicum TaxID=56689 RepID=UPI00076ABCD9|nr:replicative DNA helicase [Mycolicibacterium mucogenicum]
MGDVSGGSGDGDLRYPPQAIEAEQSTLGGMLLSKDAIADVVERLGHNDFYRPAHQMIFAAIVDLFAQGEPADPITVAAELERRGQLARIGSATYLHTLMSAVPTAANAGFYATIVLEKSKLRRLVQAGTRIAQYGYSGVDGADVDDVIARAQAEVYDVTTTRSSQDYESLDELLQPTMDELETIQNAGGPARGVPTGFTDLDEALGGLHPAQMIIIAARPGVGKALALDTPLVTPTGWTTMGAVEVGDELLGADGRPTRVVAVTEVMRGRPCYTVEFENGATIVADAAHQWPTTEGTRITGELRAGVDTIAAAAPLTGNHFAAAQLAAEPYVAGSWLADRTATRHLHLTMNDLRPYLRAELDQRTSLLLGFLSGVDRPTPHGPVVIHDNPRRPGLLDFVEELLATVGIVSHRTATTVSYIASPRPHGHRIIGVTPRPPVPVRCVQVDNDDHTYLAGRTMVPTHNSTLGLDFMRSCSIRHGMASILFSLEMSKSEIVMRLLSAEAKVKLADMRAGRMSDDDWTRIARRMGDISSAPLYIDDSPNLTMMEIRAKARRIAQQQDLRLIVVDYLQLLTSGHKAESRQQEVSEFSRSLKLLAKELEVPVVAISQLNRGPELRQDKRPMVSDLRESGSLEQDCDLVLLLHRPDATDREDPRGGEADVIIGKFRQGPAGVSVTLAHQLHYSRFTNMAR